MYIEALEPRQLLSALPGDITGDGTVDIADLNAVLSNFGAPLGDIQRVHIGHLNLVLNHFGDSLPVEPEPDARPTADNTGPTRPDLLVASGSLNITQPGVYENLNITGYVVVNASGNVTLRNFRLYATGIYGIDVQRGNVVIEDGELTGPNADVLINGGGFTARRLHLHHYGSDAFHPFSNTIIEANYAHHGGMKAESHADVVQGFGGYNIRVRGNNFDVPHSETFRSSSVIVFNTWMFPLDDVVVSGNWINGGGYSIYVTDGESGNGRPTNVYIDGNRFGRGAVYGLRYSPFYGIWQNNVWDDTGLPC